MINSESKGDGIVIGGNSTADKPLTDPPKKTALRDVQNENLGSIHKPQESSLPIGGRPSVDAIKAMGMNENVLNARRRFELELGMGRLKSTMEKYSDGSQSKNMGRSFQETPQKPTQKRDNMPPVAGFSSTGPSFPSSNSKNNKGTQAAKVTVESKSTNAEQVRTERFIRLQKFLKQCDEANPRDYMQMLFHLSPTELSDHAVQLEKRAIQLTIEEGNEIQRMKAENILGKSSPTNTSSQSTQLLQSNR